MTEIQNNSWVLKGWQRERFDSATMPDRPALEGGGVVSVIWILNF